MTYENYKQSYDYIINQTSHKPKIAIILGSGLGDLVKVMEEKESIAYSDIPHFPVSTLQGHEGNLVFGKIGDKEVVCMQGRFHYYQGFTMKEVVYPLYVMKLMGVEKVIVTNACGGINASFTPGDLMLITDYINMLGNNPLIGDNDERFGVRFPDMSEPYNESLINLAKTLAPKHDIEPKEGVYALFSGPCFETKAEIKAYRTLGADAIGMSTVPETIVANYLGMKVLGIACITNMATGLRVGNHSHEEVLEIANKASEKLCAWVEDIVKQM